MTLFTSSKCLFRFAVFSADNIFSSKDFEVIRVLRVLILKFIAFPSPMKLTLSTVFLDPDFTSGNGSQNLARFLVGYR